MSSIARRAGVVVGNAVPLGRRLFGTMPKGQLIAFPTTAKAYDPREIMASAKETPPDRSKAREYTAAYPGSRIHLECVDSVRRVVTGVFGSLRESLTGPSGVREDESVVVSDALDVDTLPESPDAETRIDLAAVAANAGRLAEVIAAGRKEASPPPFVMAQVVSRIVSITPANLEQAKIVVRGLFGTSLEMPLQETPFTSLITGAPVDVVDLEAKNLAIQQRKKAFTKDLTDQIKLEQRSQIPGTVMPLVATMTLRAWLFDESRGSIQRFNEEELSTILRKLWDIGEYDLMVELMDNSTNPVFKRDPVNIEIFCRANLRSNYVNPTLVEAIADFMEAELGLSPEVVCIQALLEEMRANVAKQAIWQLDHGTSDRRVLQETLQILSDVNPSDKAQLQESYARHAAASLEYYEKAFFINQDPRYGLRAVKQFLARDLLQGVEMSLETAHMLELTIFACHCDGGIDSNKFPIIRALFESELLLHPSDDKRFLEYGSRLIRLSTCDSKLENAIVELRNLKKITNNKEVKANADIMISILDAKLHREIDPATGKAITLDSCIERLFATKPEVSAEITRVRSVVEPIHEWERSTYSHRGSNSNYIPGNFKFGARLPAQNINRTDIGVFNSIVSEIPIATMLPGSSDTRTLSQITSESEFLEITDKIIRNRFKTDAWELENLQSDGHKIYDETTKKLIQLAGFPNEAARKTAIDSRTNISMAFAIGIGDCRQHAQVKQLLFDTWQRQGCIQAKTDYIRACTSYYEGDGFEVDPSATKAISLQVARKAVEDALGTELRIFDAQIIAPIVMEEKVDASGRTYKVPKIDADGNYFYDERNVDSVVEEHTMNVLFKYENYETGGISEIRLADAFYQKKYDFASLPLSTTSSLREGVPAGTMKAKRANGSFIDIPVKLKPTAYAGTRDEYDKGSVTELCVGLHTGLRAQDVSRLIRDPKANARVIESVSRVTLH